MTNLYSQTELPQASIRISKERLVRVLLQINSAMMMVMKLNQMSRKSFRPLLVDLKEVLMHREPSKIKPENQLVPSQLNLRDVQWLKTKLLAREVLRVPKNVQDISELKISSAC